MENKFTDRELEVLDLLKYGYTYDKIAKNLFFSKSTAKVHVANILKKLNAVNKTRAIYLALKLGIIK